MQLTVPTFLESPTYSFELRFFVDGIQMDFGAPWSQYVMEDLTDARLEDACLAFCALLHAAYPNSLVEYEVAWFSRRTGPVSRATAYEAVVPE